MPFSRRTPYLAESLLSESNEPLYDSAWKTSYAVFNMTFDTIGQRIFEQKRAPGFAFLVSVGGSVVFAKGYGVANIPADEPATPETAFAIGSLTKQFTAAAVLLLQEESKLSLEDRLESYIPGLPNGSYITLRMLLNQTSGLHNFPNTREHNWPRQGIIRPDQLIDLLRTDKPDFAPGERWAYSNTNYAMLAKVISQVSGVSYGKFLTTRIFGPLGMDQTSDGFLAQEGIATPYEWTGTSFAAAEPPLSLDLFYGAGSLVSTVQDISRWNMALLSHQLLNAELLRNLWTGGRLAGGQPVGYAMGFVLSMIGSHRQVWHNGYTPRAGGYCFNAIFPDDRL
ncbi:MAG: serine hydrolase domain-containing protein, partial [Janthinobacterium lividum]